MRLNRRGFMGSVLGVLASVYAPGSLFETEQATPAITKRTAFAGTSNEIPMLRVKEAAKAWRDFKEGTYCSAFFDAPIDKHPKGR